MTQSTGFPMLMLWSASNSGGPTSPSGAGGAASSALSLGLDDVPASPAALLLASKAAALGADVTVITKSSTKLTLGIGSQISTIRYVSGVREPLGFSEIGEEPVTVEPNLKIVCR